MAEGKATIVQIIRPATFTPNVQFDIRPRMKNIGAEDIFWVRLINTGTGKVLKETTRTTPEEPGGLWTSPMYLTLTQTTDFHAMIQFGHLFGSIKVIDDFEAFVIPVAAAPPEPPPPEPPPPTPPPTIWDWIIGFVLSGFENLLGWQHGSLLTLLANVKDLITNFFGDIADFFGDVIGSVVDIIKENVGDIFDWLSDQFIGFVDWLKDLPGSIADFVTDKISDSLDFLTDKVTDFFDFLKDLPGSIADYIGDAVSGFIDWSNDQLVGIWEGIESHFINAISGFVEAFFGGLDTGIEQAKGSPLHSDEPVRNPVLKGLQKVVREHRKKHNRDIITGERKHGNV